jgi:RNA polymerase sigma factor (TIGR02999 family)
MTSEITVLLQSAHKGDAGSLSHLFTLLYDELRTLAQARLRGNDSTLTPTVLVHEVWLRLCGDGTALPVESRRHFFALAAQAMRWILVDHARRHLAARRGGTVVRLELNDETAGEMRSEELLALDGALDTLARLDPARRELVELRYFAGLEFDELATLLGRSARTLKREWAAARAVLYSLME